MAANELESIACTIDSTNLQPFLSSILSTNSTDKLAVRKHYVQLLSLLLHSLLPNSLSPFLPKILAHLSRHLRDPDSSIRFFCIAAVSALSSRNTKLPFSAAFLKPLFDTLFTKKKANSQIEAVLCLATAIYIAHDPDPARMVRALLPRLEKLVKRERFKARAAILME